MPWKACPSLSRTTSSYPVNPSCSLPVSGYMESTSLFPSSLARSVPKSSFLETGLLGSEASSGFPLETPGFLTSYSLSSFTPYRTSSKFSAVSSTNILTSWFIANEEVDIIPTGTTRTTGTTASSETTSLPVTSSAVGLMKSLSTHAGE